MPEVVAFTLIAGAMALGAAVLAMGCDWFDRRGRNDTR